MQTRKLFISMGTNTLVMQILIKIISAFTHVKPTDIHYFTNLKTCERLHMYCMVVDNLAETFSLFTIVTCQIYNPKYVKKTGKLSS